MIEPVLYHMSAASSSDKPIILSKLILYLVAA